MLILKAIFVLIILSFLAPESKTNYRDDYKNNVDDYNSRSKNNSNYDQFKPCIVVYKLKEGSSASLLADKQTFEFKTYYSEVLNKSIPNILVVKDKNYTTANVYYDHFYFISQTEYNKTKIPYIGQHDYYLK